jgi:hypothetical protein
MLRKLEWEIEQLHQTEGGKMPDQAYRAFNAAVTTWHLTDWVWEDMTIKQRTLLSLKRFEDLKGLVINQSRPIYLCRQIATASKHAVVKIKNDPDVKTSTEAAKGLGQSSDEMRTLAGVFAAIAENGWVIEIIDGNERKEAVTTFKEACEYWTQFIYGYDIQA